MTGTFQNSGNGAVTLSGGLTNGSLIQSGSGILTLTATNGYAGSTGVTGGTLNVLGVISQTGSVTVDGNPAAIIVDGAGSSLTTPGGMIVGGTGIGVLNLQNGGGVNAATVTLANSVGSFGTLNIANGAGLFTAGTVTGGSGTAIINFNYGGYSYTFGSQITGNIALNQLCSGITSLTGANSYTGVTTLAAGTLSFANGSLGTAGLVDLTGTSILQWHDTNTQDISARLKIEDGITVFLDTQNNNVTFGSALQTGTAHTGAVIKNGMGILTLAGANSYSGMTGISMGTVNLANQNALQESTVIINGGGLTFDSSAAGHAFTLGGLTGVGNGPGIVLQDNAANAVALSVGNNNANTTYQDALSGSGSLIKIGTGRFTLSGTNSYTGGTTLTGGILSLGSTGALGTTGTISFGGGTLQYTSSNGTDYSSRFSSADHQFYNVDTNGQNVTWASALTSSGGSLNKSGAGILTLTASNSYSGGTSVINGGGLCIGDDSQLGAVPGSPVLNVTLSNGLLMNSGSLLTLNANRIISLGAGGGFIEAANSGVFTVNGPITGVGGLSQSWDSGVLVLNGSNHYGGSTTIGSTVIHSWSDPTANPVLRLGNSNALPGTDLSFGTNSQGNAATLDMNGFNATVGALSGSTNAVVDVSNTGTSVLTVGNLDASGTFQGVLQNTTGTLSLIKIGTGTLIVSGSNNFSGPSAINLGTLILANQNALQHSTASINGGSLVFNSSVSGHAFTFGGLSGVGGLLLEDNALNAVALSVGNNNANTTDAGALTGSGSLIKTGTGTLNLTGANTYTGSTTISLGTLEVSGGGMITQTSGVSVGSNATLAVDGTGSSVTSLGQLAVGSGTGTGTLNLQNGGVVNAGTLGDGTLVLATGTASSGTLNVGGISGGTAGTLNAAQVNSGGGSATINFDQTDSSQFSPQITGNIIVNQIGLGQTILTAANTYTGNTIISSGTLDLANQNAVQNSTVIMNGGNLVFDHSAGGAFTLGGLAAALSGSGYDIALEDNALTPNPVAVSVGNNNVTTIYAGVLSGAGSLIKIGTGTLSLTASNSYSGGTELSSGVLSFANGALGASGTVDFIGNSTLQWNGTNVQDISGRLKIEDGVNATVDTNGNNVTFASTLQTGSAQSGALTKIGAGKLTLTVANQYTGGSNLVAGILSFGNGALGTSGTVDFVGNSTLQWNGSNTQDISGRLKIEDGVVATVDTNGNNVTFASKLQTGSSKTGALTKAGSGVLTLTATNDYLGGTNLNAGTLSFIRGGLGVSGTVDFIGNSTLQWNGTNTQDISGRLKIEDVITATVDTNGNDLRFASALQTGTAQTGALTKAGAGTLWLTATNVYKGATTVTSGTLQVSLGGLITQTGSIMVDGANPADHATFLIDGLIDSGTVTTLGNVTIGNTGFGTLNIEDGGFLQTGSNGGGTVTLASAGGSVGTLNIIGNTSGAGTLNAGIVTGGDGTAVINFQHQDANYVFAPKITGSIALNQTGSGTTILTGSDSYTGATTISSGTLQVSGGGVISKTNAITVDSQVTATNATLSINGTTSSSVTSTGNLTVGNDRIGTLNVTNGGSLTNKESFIGNNAGSNGTLTVDGAGSMWTMSDALNIGYNGTGTVNVSNGGAVTTQVPFAGAGADIYVGYNGGGSGTLNITTSGTVNCFNGYIGYGAGSNGTVTVSGPGSLWNTTAAFSSFNVGINGTGTLNITNGGMVGNYQSTIGNNAGSNGTVNVDGAGSSWQISSITTGLTVGNGGTGTLNITNGGNVTNDVGTIVNHLGTLNVNGAGSTLTHGDTGFPSTLNISGTLNITNGGSVSDSDGYGMGVVNVDGADSTWTNTSTLAVSGTGVVNITHGGKVTNGGGSIDGSSTVNVDGNNSTLSNSGVFTSSGTLNITNGGEVNDLSGSVHGGTTTVSGTGSTWRNSLDFSVDSGTLTIQNGGEVHDLSGSVHGGTTIVSGSGSTWVHDTDFAVESGTLTIQNGGKVTATPLLTNAAYSVSVSSDLLGGNATVNLLTGGTLMVNGPTSGVAVTTLYLGAFLGDHGVLNIGNGGGAGILNVTEVDCDWIAGASGTINFNHNEAAYSFDPSIQGLITVNQKGSGTTLLNNSNSYFGDTTITAGTLELSNSAATGLSTVILNGGSLTFDSSVSGHAFTLISLSATASGIGYDIALHDTSGNPVALTLTGNYFDGNGHWFSLNNNYAGILSGNGSLTMAWSSSYGVLGSQTLSGANTYTGQTTLTTGTLILANQNAVQNSTVTMNGGSLVFDHSVNGHAFTVGGLSATSSGAGYDLELRDSAASAVALSVGNNNSDVSYAGVLSGIGSLNKIGTGTQILSGINTYSGGTIVTSGTLELSGANLSSGTTTLSGGKLKLSNPNAVQNSTVLMNGGDLVFNGSAFTFGGLSASADGPAYWVTLEGSGSNPVVLTVGNNNADTLFASRLIGAGSLIKTGTGTLLFTGGSVYQGATTVNNGTLAVGLGGQISQTSSITVDSITPGTSASLLASGTLLDSTVTSLGNAAIGVSGTGFLKIQDDGLVNLGGISGSGTLTLASGTGSVGTLAIGNGGVAGTLNAAVVTGGSGTGLIQFNHSNVNYVFAPQIAGSTAVNQMGPGTTILTASNTHFGATNLSAGTLNLKNIEALQNSTLVMNGGGLVFDSSVYQHTFTLGGLSGTSSGAGYDIALQDNTGSPVAEVVSVGNNNANTSYAGTLSGSGSIIKIGTGTLTLTGTNQYTGGTTISSGTLQLGNASTVNGSVVGDIIDNAALVFANPSDLTDAGHITGVGSLTKIGAGTLTLSGINHYSGGTNLDAGTLCLGSLGAIGDSGTIRFGGGILQYSGSNTLDYSDRFSAASGQLYNVDTNGQNVAWTTALTSVGGSLTKSGSGTLTLTGSSSYTGATTVAQGTLIVSGSLSAASPVRVGDSVTSGTAVFGGGGIVGDVHIGSTASSGAILCPDAGAFGGSAGTTLTTGALVFSTGASTLSIEIGRTSLGTDVSSHVRVSSIDLTSGGNLQLSLLNTDHTIINGDLFFLILSGSPVTGNFTSLNGSATSLVEGATFTYSGQEYEITYQASNQLSQFSGGQDVALWAVPEPSTWGMLLAGAVVLGFVQRLRRWRLE